jgi:cell division protein FtsZ
VIATGFEGGGGYRPERALGSFLNAGGESEPAGAAIPSFLLNRRQG